MRDGCTVHGTRNAGQKAKSEKKHNLDGQRGAINLTPHTLNHCFHRSNVEAFAISRHPVEKRGPGIS